MLARIDGRRFPKKSLASAQPDDEKVMDTQFCTQELPGQLLRLEIA